MNWPEELFRACETHDNKMLKNFNYDTVSAKTIIAALNITISTSNITGTATILSEIVYRRMSVSLLPSLTSAIKIGKNLPDTSKRLIQLHFNAFEALDIITEVTNYITTCRVDELPILFDCALDSNHDICVALSVAIANRAEFYTYQSTWFKKFCNTVGLPTSIIKCIVQHPKFNPNSPAGDYSPICSASRVHNYPLIEELLNNPLIDLSDSGPYLIQQTDDPFILNLLLRHKFVEANNIIPLAVCRSKTMPEYAKIALYENNPCLDPSIDRCYVLRCAIAAGQKAFVRFLLADARCGPHLQGLFGTAVAVANIQIIDYLLPHIWLTEDHFRDCRSIEVLIAMLRQLKFDGRGLQSWIDCLDNVSVCDLGKRFGIDPIQFMKRLLNINSTICFKMHDTDWANSQLAMFYITMWPEQIKYDKYLNPLSIAARYGAIDVFTRLMETGVDPSIYSNAALVEAATKQKNAGGGSDQTRAGKDKIVNMLLTDVRVLLMGVNKGQLVNKQYYILTRKINSLLTPILIAEKRAKVQQFHSELIARCRVASISNHPTQVLVI